jgi:hypothetical protein
MYVADYRFVLSVPSGTTADEATWLDFLSGTSAAPAHSPPTLPDLPGDGGTREPMSWERDREGGAQQADSLGTGPQASVLGSRSSSGSRTDMRREDTIPKREDGDRENDGATVGNGSGGLSSGEKTAGLKSDEDKSEHGMNGKSDPGLN